MIRFFDILFSFIGLVLLFPVCLVIALVVVLDSKGGPLYLQDRVGRNNRGFRLIKFRSMTRGAERQGGLTVGTNDARITRAGKFLRKYKLDELPQLLNVLTGTMSLVGPRPEIRRYVDLYTPEQKKVLLVRPGITDFASVEYINENEILGKAADPEKTYVEEIMPAKIRMNMRFIEQPVLRTYFRIIGKTLNRLVMR